MTEHSKRNYNNIFWGLALVTIGILLALRNFDVFYFRWHSLLRLWPLLFVFWGISLIPVKSYVKMLLTAISILLGILLISVSPAKDYFWDGFSYNHSDKEIIIEDDETIKSSRRYKSKIDEVNVKLEAGATEFKIIGNANGLYELFDRSDEKSFNVHSENDGRTEKLHIKQLKRKNKDNDFFRSAELHLNPHPAYNFDIDVGAAELYLDLSELKVNMLDVYGGASDIEIIMGDRQDKAQLEISSGVAHITIKVPESVACEIHTETFLAAKDFNGFNKIGNGYYQTANFSESDEQIIIELDAAISEIDVLRY